MTLTAADIARIRAVAVADKARTYGKGWNEVVTPDVVIALCERIEKQQDALNLVEMALVAVHRTLENYA